MGTYWRYFRDTLRWPLIASPGPLAALVEGGAAALDAVREVILQLRDQFLPVRCEDLHLTYFARSRGLARGPREPEEHWQARVRFAYHWWISGGRASALAEALRSGFGFTEVAVINLGTGGTLYDESTDAPLIDETTGAVLLAENSGRWAEFMVICYLAGNEQVWTEEQVVWAINEVKPARSKLAELIFVAGLHDETTLAGLYDESSGRSLTT
jgi:hypothetical protein